MSGQLTPVEEKKTGFESTDLAYVEHASKGKDALDNPNLIEDARAATEAEHRLTLMQGLKRYPKAVMFSLIVSTCIMYASGSSPVLLLDRSRTLTRARAV